MHKDFSKIAKDPRKLVILMIISALLGAMWFVLFRAITIDANGPHYHANFHLYIHGERELFEEGIYYEEVSSCGGSENDPKARVHLHDFIGDVVHVHDASSTWGNFFEVLGFVLGNNVLYVDGKAYLDTSDSKLSFVLNGEVSQSVASKTIKSEDVLLISYGNESNTELIERYDGITQNAAEYNAVADPSACQGSQNVGLWDRIKLVVGID